MADAMYAPVVTRFTTYDVKLEPRLKTYADAIMNMPEMAEWIDGRARQSRKRSRSSRSNIRQARCLFDGRWPGRTCCRLATTWRCNPAP